MAVSVETPIQSATANGVSTVFPYSFTILKVTDLIVVGLTGGVQATYIYGVDYTLTGLGTNAGSVVFSVPPTVGTTVTAYRSTSLSRSPDYQNNGDFRAVTINADLNRIWYLLQEMVLGGRGAATSLRVPNGETVDPLPPANQRGGFLLGFDGQGKLSLIVAAAQSASALALSLLGAAGTTLINFVAAGVGAILRPLQDKLRENVSILDYGGVADDTTDVYPAVIKAIAALGAQGGVIHYPRGKYVTLSGSIPDVANVTHKGHGINATTVRAGGDFPVFARAGGATNVINGGGVCRMTIRGFWNQNPAQNINSHGLVVNGSNGADYYLLRFLSCRIAFNASFNYESACDRLYVLGQGADQNYNGFVFNATTNVNPNNAFYMTKCVATFTYGDGWLLVNPNGSDFWCCSAEACGGYGFVIGMGTNLEIPTQFSGFDTCTGDTCVKSNWVVQGSTATPCQDIQFSNCWSGITGENNWVITNARKMQFVGCNGISAAKSAMLITSSSIAVTGFVGADYNSANIGSNGIDLANSSGSVITGSSLTTPNMGAGGGRGVAESGSSNNNVVMANYLPTGAQQLGATSKFRNNSGFITETSGSVTIATGATSSVVTHGLGLTPTLGEINLTNAGNYPSWITTITGTQFTINIPAQGSPSAVGWSVAITR